MKALEINLVVPDLWQQEAVRALRQGQDVVVHAPTGAGKTYIFELLYPNLKAQAVFTVPTRALANDKRAEWLGRGWDVGIATGDVAINLQARVLVATLETQKGKFLRRQGPKLLVIDEYQMIADEVRGVNYELAIALAPRETQLLLLSGSVHNPHDVVAWLQRLGRDAVLIAHRERPVPLDEVDLQSLPEGGPTLPRTFWPRLVAKALRADLGPILVFAPRRNASEDLALMLSSALPVDDPLALSREQETLAGPRLAKLLRNRVAFHHSGLSYALRAGLIEPLAKAGQLHVVVATMGLASGINFSMRSVLVTDTRFMAGNFEQQVEPDELLQMFGRAGRRGLDEAGYVLVAHEGPRLADARPRQLKRAGPLDWPALISVMGGAAETGVMPFTSAAELNRSLFSVQKVPLGIEHSVTTGAMPCGLWVDSERARFVRRPVTEMRCPDGQWVAQPLPRQATLGATRARDDDGRWLPALRLSRTLDGVGIGNLCRLRTKSIYGRELPLAALAADGTLRPVTWLRKKLRQKVLTREELDAGVLPRLPEFSGGGELVELVERGSLLSARLDYSNFLADAFFDPQGTPLQNPETRAAPPAPCRECPERPWCETAEISTTAAYAWRRLGLVEADGTPTRRGIIFGFFNNGEGLAVAAALEDFGYPMEDLVYDLANLRAGHRFAAKDSPFGGRLGTLCQTIYRREDHPGYLAMGVPISYGAGAAEVARAVTASPSQKYKIVSESLRPGDIERALIEWRSLLRHIAGAPDFAWDRWTELKHAVEKFLEDKHSAALVIPPLLPSQQRRPGQSFRLQAMRG